MNERTDQSDQGDHSTLNDRTDRLATVLAPPLAELDLTLYDVEIAGSGRGRTLRVLIDRSRGALGDLASRVDLEDVTRATEALGPVLDAAPVVAAVLPGTYLLEVSSPASNAAITRRALSTAPAPGTTRWWSRPTTTRSRSRSTARIGAWSTPTSCRRARCSSGDPPRSRAHRARSRVRRRARSRSRQCRRAADEDATR